MIKITKSKLIIEIDCGEYQSPLSLLVEMKEGLLKMIEVADFHESNHQRGALEFGMVQIARLINHMSYSIDQADILQKLMTENDKEAFNNRA